jgi:hypothetical protein
MVTVRNNRDCGVRVLNVDLVCTSKGLQIAQAHITVFGDVTPHNHVGKWLLFFERRHGLYLDLSARSSNSEY